jgi:hypothetical protein
MAEKLKSLAFDAWADIAERGAAGAIYLAQEQERVLGITTYLMTAFVAGNIMSAVWNIYLGSVA